MFKMDAWQVTHFLLLGWVRLNVNRTLNVKTFLAVLDWFDLHYQASVHSPLTTTVA